MRRRKHKREGRLDKQTGKKAEILENRQSGMQAGLPAGRHKIRQVGEADNKAGIEEYKRKKNLKECWF